jgi:hypothetical protein
MSNTNRNGEGAPIGRGPEERAGVPVYSFARHAAPDPRPAYPRLDEVLAAMRVQLIEDEPAPPDHVRAEVIVAKADGVGLCAAALTFLNDHAAVTFRVSGERHLNRALLAFHTYVPKDRADRLAALVAARWTARVRGGGPVNSHRCRMPLKRLTFVTASGGRSADEPATILRRAGLNILELFMSAEPTGPDGRLTERRAATLDLTVEIDPAARAQWDRARAELLAWAAANDWFVSG